MLDAPLVSPRPDQESGGEVTTDPNEQSYSHVRDATEIIGHQGDYIRRTVYDIALRADEAMRLGADLATAAANYLSVVVNQGELREKVIYREALNVAIMAWRTSEAGNFLPSALGHVSLLAGDGSREGRWATAVVDAVEALEQKRNEWIEADDGTYFDAPAENRAIAAAIANYRIKNQPKEQSDG